EIALSKAAQDQSGRLTIPAGATCTVSLKLQPSESGKLSKTRHASDVKSARLQTPDSFTFHFSQKEQGIDSVGRCGWTLFGQKLSFEWNSRANPFYDATLKGVVVPL